MSSISATTTQATAAQTATQTAAQAVTAAIEQPKVRPLQYAVFTVCFILSMLEGFDVLAISYASVAISEQLLLPPTQVGLLISAGLLGMTLGALFLSILSDMYGRRRMILIALTISGSSMCATGLAESLWLIGLLRVITGLGVGILLATVTTTVSEFMPMRHRSLAVGMATAGYAVGATLGGLVAAGLIGRYGWPSLFYGGGVLTLLMVVIVWFVLPESPHFLALRRPAGALGGINRVLTRLGSPRLTALEGEVQAVHRPGPGRLLSGDLRRRTLWLWLCFALAFATLYFLFGWIPKIVADSGISQQIAIYALTFFNLGAIVGVGGLGYAARLFGLGRMILIFMLLGALLMLVFPFTEGVALLALCTVLGALVQGGFVGLYAVAASIYPSEVRATGIGWGIGLGRIGAVLSPYIAGVLLEQGLSPLVLFAIFAALLASSALLVTQLKV